MLLQLHAKTQKRSIYSFSIKLEKPHFATCFANFANFYVEKQCTELARTGVRESAFISHCR